MQFDPKSLQEMTSRQIKKYWPNLTPLNYHKTSDETIIYNCVAWVNKIVDRPIDFSVDDEGDPLPEPDLTPTLYISYFESLGFTRCETQDLEAGLEKIALYESYMGTFEHVARQLESGNWTSKMGELEDIEHYSLEALEGDNNYGRATIFMQRPRN